MTELHRTPLSTSQKVEIGLQAATCQNYGIPLTDLSDEVGVSRPTLYETQATVQTLLEQHFSPPEQEKGFYVWVDRAQLERAEVAIRVENRACMRGIENVLPFIYPGIERTTLPTSLGSIQKICKRAEKNAQIFNRKPLYHAIENATLDEMFSQGDPILAGVDLDSGFLFLLEQEKARGGTEWANALEVAKAQGLDLKKVVKDAGTGMASGVTQAFPKAEQRDDCFHVLYVLGQTLYLLERKAYGSITAQDEAEIEYQKCKKKMKKNTQSAKKTTCKKGKNQASLAQKWDWRKRQCVDAIDRYDHYQAAYDKVVEGLSYVDLETGELRSGEVAGDLFQQAADEIRKVDYYKAHKLANYLENRIPGLILSTQALYDTLQALGESDGKGGQAMISRICQLLRLDGEYEQKDRLTSTDQKNHRRLKRWLKSQDECLVGKVKYALEHRYRASSAIESFNAALRPYLYLQKRVSDDFLELFQAYYNTRIRRFGRHKGTSAYGYLRGEEHEDWLTLLGFPPSSTLH